MQNNNIGMPPKPEPEWQRQQVTDRFKYKKDSWENNKQATEYNEWYGEVQSRTDPSSEAQGVNRLKTTQNQVGYAMCMDVVDPAEREAEKRKAFRDNYPNAFKNERKPNGHVQAIKHASNAALEHKEQSKKHYRASKGQIVEYKEDHKPSNWRKDIQEELKAADDKNRAQKAATKIPVVDDEGFQVAKGKRSMGWRR